MNLAFHQIDGGYALMYDTGSGVVGVVVRRLGSGVGRIDVADRDAALWARGKTDAEFAASDVAKAARNKYGVATMRSIFRDVKELFPEIRAWIVDPKTRAKTGAPRVWRV